MNKQGQKWSRKLLIILFWLFIWQMISMAIGNSIVIVGPAAVLKAFLSQIITKEFWITILYSFGKISLGFLGAFFLAVSAGALAVRIPFVEELLQPVVLLMKSVPVASFVVLALIWMGAAKLPVFIAFVVVFPVIYVNTSAGIRSTDKKLVEMAQVFHMSPLKKCLFIYRPALMPYLLSSCKVALGMSWKSGVAAEVIGVVGHSIGEKLYLSKIYLETADLLAWTAVIILLSAAFERSFLWILRKGGEAGNAS